MNQRYTAKNIQQQTHQATGKADWEIKRDLKKLANEGNKYAANAQKSIGKSLSSQGTEKYFSNLRKAGISTNADVGQMMRRIEKQAAAGNKPKLTIEDMRKQREAMAKKMVGLYAREREATSAGKPASATTAALRSTAKSSALTPKKVTGPKATTSALRSNSGTAAKPAAEEKPQAIDLAID